MVKQIQNLMYPCNCCNQLFLTRIYIAAFVFEFLQFYFNPFPTVQAVMSLGLPPLASSLLTKIGIIYTQLLQVGKTFPIIPRLMTPEICTKSLVKN